MKFIVKLEYTSEVEAEDAEEARDIVTRQVWEDGAYDPRVVSVDLSTTLYDEAVLKYDPQYLAEVHTRRDLVILRDAAAVEARSPELVRVLDKAIAIHWDRGDA